MCHLEPPFPVSGGAGTLEGKFHFAGADRDLPAFFASPDTGPCPAVLVIHDVYGATPFYEDFTRRLAGEGFFAMLPDFFVRQGPLPARTREAAFARRAKLDQATMLRDIAGAITCLREHAETNGKAGTVGFCMGGTYVMLSAGRDPLPDAAVAFYGFPNAAPTDLAPLVPLQEVDRVRVPLLGLWGDQDAGVGMDNVRAYDEALANAGLEHEFIVYPGLGHGFMTFDPAAPSYEGAQDAFERAVTFLRERLA